LPVTALKEKKPSAPAPVSTVEPLLLTLADVCALLNLSKSTIYRIEKTSPLPGRVKLGGQVRYHRQVIEKWLLEQIEKENGGLDK
jgi:excisionase family DNA binding protein